MSPTVRASWCFNSAQTPAEVEKLVTDGAGKDSGVLALTDEKGRRFLVQAARIAYVEIGAADVAPGRLRHRSRRPQRVADKLS